MRKLLEYFLKKRLHTIIITTVILMLVVFVTQYDASYIRYRNYVSGQQYDAYADNLPFGYIIFFVITLSVIITIFEFSFKMKKVTVDQMYSLPIKRSKLYLTKYILGLIEILFPTTISFLLMIIMILGRPNLFNFAYVLPYYFGVVFLTIVLFTSLVFVFTRCNTVMDGIINMFLYTLVIPITIGGVNSIINISYIDYFSDANAFNYTLISPLIYFNTIFDYLFCNKTNLLLNNIDACILSIVVGVVLAVTMGILFFVLLKKQKAEDAEQKSNSIFAYKSMIPIYTFFSILLLIEASSVAIIMIVIASYIGYVIKNRGFKIAKQDLIVWLSTVALAVVIYIIFSSIYYQVLATSLY